VTTRGNVRGETAEENALTLTDDGGALRR